MFVRLAKCGLVRPRRLFSTSNSHFRKTVTSVLEDVDNMPNPEYDDFAKRCFDTATDHSCYIIHPYVKWGPRKVAETNPQRQLEEATALVRTLAPWTVHDSIAVPLDNLDRKQLFGKGTLEKLTRRIRQDNKITAVFINTGTLRNKVVEELEGLFKVPILDRYRVVMQILRLHATSKHAKLQVALAEIPYLKSQLRKFDSHFMATSDYDTRRLILQNREQKIKAEIKKLRSHREVLRQRRRENDYPIIAVVGYTNAGKTSLIKALTGDKNLRPKNQLFATLDVTMHAGVLQSRLEVLFVDTVGFISDIPTDLIECFVATLEDAMFADLILHVEDISSEDYLYQRKHVQQTLESLANQMNSKDILSKVITVGNKCDLVKSVEYTNGLSISAATGIGLDLLREKLDKEVLRATDRSVITFRLPAGGEEMRWLYKNSAVVSVKEDFSDSQLQMAKVVITKPKLEKFKHHFLRSR